MPLPCSASLLTNCSISGREYGGLSHTRPIHSLLKPSWFLLYIRLAVGHNGSMGAHGSVSKTPSASIISFGVYHSSVELADFSNVVFIHEDSYLVLGVIISVSFSIFSFNFSILSFAVFSRFEKCFFMLLLSLDAICFFKMSSLATHSDSCC